MWIEITEIEHSYATGIKTFTSGFINFDKISYINKEKAIIIVDGQFIHIDTETANKILGYLKGKEREVNIDNIFN